MSKTKHYVEIIPLSHKIRRSIKNNENTRAIIKHYLNSEKYYNKFAYELKQMEEDEFNTFISLLENNEIFKNDEDELKDELIKLNNPNKELIPKAAQITANDENILFFLGAGASKPEPTGIPIITELLEELWKKADQMDNKNLKKIKNWCEEININNIEDVLTATYLAEAGIQNSKTLNLLEKMISRSEEDDHDKQYREQTMIYSLKETLQNMFAVLVGMMINKKPNKIHKNIAELIKKQKKLKQSSTIVTTNYDTVMEKALNNKSESFHYSINEISSSNDIPILKMHGSLNWYYCDSCQNLNPIDNMEKVEEIFNLGIYPVTGMCKECESTNKLLIVPPISYKYAIYLPLINLWNKVEKAFDNAKTIIIIGYSFNTSDEYITKMLTKALNQDDNKKIILFDLSSKPINRLKKYLKIKTDSEFVKNNFIGIEGNANETFPQFIEKLLSEYENRQNDATADEDENKAS